MRIVKRETYTHIARGGDWEKGQIYFVGQRSNPFFSYFDSHGRNVLLADNSVLCTNVLGHMAVDYLRSGKAQSDMEEKYDFSDQLSTTRHLVDALDHFLRLTRELVFEEVRLKHFPELPSRQRCLWVTDNDEDAIAFWMKRLNQERGRVVRLSLTGKLHEANEVFLDPSTNSLDYIRKQAFSYWSGDPGFDNKRTEYLFVGSAEVLSVEEWPKETADASNGLK